jgi:hypothetical protein
MKLSRLLGRGRPSGQAEKLLASPLNDPELLQLAFGSRKPTPEQVERGYFAQPPQRRPVLSRWFDPAFYLEANADVAESGADPYLHFISHGIEEGRDPHPRIDLVHVRAKAARGADDTLDLALLADYLRRDPQMLGTRPDASAAARRRAGPGLMGGFDGFQDGLAVGWAFDSRDPSIRHQVEIVRIVDGEAEVVGRGRGEKARADLRDMGYGDGRYHFEIKLSDVLSDGQAHRLRARVGAHWLDNVHEFRAEGAALRGFDPLPAALTRAIATEASAGWSDRRETDEFVQRMLDINLMLGMREIAAAAQELQAIDAAHPGIELVQLKLAEAMMRLGQPGPAAPLFEAASRSERLAGWALLGLGDAMLSLGKRAEAEAHYRRGHELAPSLPRLAARVASIGFRDVRTHARELASEGNTRGALELLMPELIGQPENKEVCDLVIGILDAAEGEPRATAPWTARAERSRRLLEVVMAHAEQRTGIAR